MKTKRYKLLLVEDDINFGAVLKSYLELNDFDVDWVDDGKYAIPKFESADYDLVLLDVMLPNIDGFSIAKSIKSKNSKVPFIFITAKTLRDDIVEGYKTGADDYITKPFDSEILLYKIKAILSRGTNIVAQHETQTFTIGDFTFNYELRSLTLKNDTNIQTLSPKESELLQMLVLKNGEILPKVVALNTIWGDANYFTGRSMDVYIAKLRKLLANDKNIKIVTHHGAGYRLIT
ncbi:MAG: response regulator transcription factor [Bacteroidota bacterium]